MNSTLDCSLHFLIHFVCLSFCLCILFLPAYCSVLKNRLNGWIYSWILAITQEAILRFLFCFLHFSALWIFCASNRSQKSTSEGVLFPEDTAPEAPGMLRLLLCLYYHNLSTSLLNRAPPPDEMKMLKVLYLHLLSSGRWYRTPWGFVGGCRECSWSYGSLLTGYTCVICGFCHMCCFVFVYCYCLLYGAEIARAQRSSPRQTSPPGR